MDGKFLAQNGLRTFLVFFQEQRQITMKGGGKLLQLSQQALYFWSSSEAKAWNYILVPRSESM
jgi:hypothetical protein